MSVQEKCSHSHSLMIHLQVKRLIYKEVHHDVVYNGILKMKLPAYPTRRKWLTLLHPLDRILHSHLKWHLEEYVLAWKCWWGNVQWTKAECSHFMWSTKITMLLKTKWKCIKLLSRDLDGGHFVLMYNSLFSTRALMLVVVESIKIPTS